MAEIRQLFGFSTMMQRLNETVEVGCPYTLSLSGYWLRVGSRYLPLNEWHVEWNLNDRSAESVAALYRRWALSELV